MCSTSTPAPSEIERGRDFFGNGVAWLVVDAPHEKLTISTRSRIDVTVAPLPVPEGTPVWNWCAPWRWPAWI